MDIFLNHEGSSNVEAKRVLDREEKEKDFLSAMHWTGGASLVNGITCVRNIVM
jgi:hypothetical protein